MEMYNQLVNAIIDNRDDNNLRRDLGCWIDDDMTKSEQKQVIKENLKEIIYDWADDTYVSDVPNAPQYYSLHLNGGAISIKIDGDNISIIGRDRDAAAACSAARRAELA